jgi:di/tripeptidase
MTAAQTLLNTPAFLHGDIRIGFTPDEEIGAGTKYFDIKNSVRNLPTPSTATHRAN